MTYQKLYHALVKAIDEALSFLEDGKCIKAHEIMQNALYAAENDILEADELPDSPQ